MGRVRMVTRTVDITTVEVMTLNVKTAEVTISNYELTGLYDNESALKTLKKSYETDEMKFVHINSSSTSETLYGMTEEDFIKYAKILPPR